MLITGAEDVVPGPLFVPLGRLCVSENEQTPKSRGCYELAQEWLANAQNGDRQGTKLTEESAF